MPLFKLLAHVYALIHLVWANTKNQEKFTQECVNKILNLYVRPSGFTVILNFGKGFIDLNFSFRTTVIKSNDRKELISFRLIKADAYVIVMSESINKEVFYFLVKSSEWNPKAKFVIIYQGNATSLFMVLREYYVYDVIVLKSRGEIDILTYFPYDSTNGFAREVLVDKCVKGNFTKNADLFPNKLPKSWKGVTVKVLLIKYVPYVFSSTCEETTRWCGAEANIFRLIQKTIGFKAEYIVKPYENWGHKEPNGSYIAGSGGLQNYEFDVGIGVFFPNSSEIWDFDLSYPYMEDSINWVVPASKPQPHWENGLQIFPWYIWLSICILLFCSSLVFYFLASIKLDKSSHRKMSSCVLSSLQCLLGQAVPCLPKTGYVRIFFALWVFFSYIILAYFQSKVTASMNFSTFTTHISTVQELIDSKLKFGFYPDSAFQFSNKEDQTDLYIYTHYIPCSRGSGCTNRTAYKRDFATAKLKRYLKHRIKSHLLGSDGRALVHIVEEQVRFVLISMAFAKGFPLFERINKLLMQFKSHGVIAKYYDSMELSFKMILAKAQSVRTADALSFDEFRGIFCLLFVGLAVALIVFVVEYSAKPRKLRRRRKKVIAFRL